MRAILPALLLLPALPIFGQAENTTVLTLVKEDGFNEMDIDLNIDILGASDATSDLTGTINVTLDINPGTHRTDELTLDSSDVSASDFTLERPGFLTNYRFEAEGLKIAANTLNPPGQVDPDTGVFEASQYRLIANQGTLSGSAYTLATGTIAIDPPFDFSVFPIEGVGTGTGTITVTPTTRTDTRQNYDVVAVIPVALSQTLENIQDTGFGATVDLVGTIKAVGTTFIELLDYPAWATAQGLPDDTPADTNLSSEVSNYLFYSLGFDRDSAPSQLLNRNTSGFSLSLGPDRIWESVIIQWSTDGFSWEQVPEEFMIAGTSLIEKYSEPTAVVAGFGGATKRFYRVIPAP